MMIVRYQGLDYEIPESDDCKKLISAIARREFALRERQVLLGYSTTEALLHELSARGRASHSSDGDKLALAASELILKLPKDMLAYSTVQGEH